MLPGALSSIDQFCKYKSCWAAPALAQAEPSWLIYRPSFPTFIELLLSKGFYPSYFIQLAWLAGIPVWLIEKFTLIIFINCLCHVLVTFVLPQDNHKRIDELRLSIVLCIMVKSITHWFLIITPREEVWGLLNRNIGEPGFFCFYLQFSFYFVQKNVTYWYMYAVTI